MDQSIRNELAYVLRDKAVADWSLQLKESFDGFMRSFDEAYGGETCRYIVPLSREYGILGSLLLRWCRELDAQ